MASTLVEPNIPSKNGKVWVKINVKKREGEMVAENDVYAEVENTYDIGDLKEAQRKRVKLSQHNYTSCLKG